MDTPDFKSPWTYNLKESDPRLDPDGNSYTIIKENNFVLMALELIDRAYGKPNSVILIPSDCKYLLNLAKIYRLNKFINLQALETDIEDERYLSVISENFDINMQFHLAGMHYIVLDMLNLSGIRKQAFTQYLFKTKSPKLVDYFSLFQHSSTTNPSNVKLYLSSSIPIFPWELMDFDKPNYTFWNKLFTRWMVKWSIKFEDCVKKAVAIGFDVNEIPALSDSQFILNLKNELKVRLKKDMGLINDEEIDSIIQEMIPSGIYLLK